MSDGFFEVKSTGHRMKICSLFSGIGGLELGLEAAGVGETLWQVEQDAFCRSVLARHWPEARRFEDVRTVRAGDIAGAELICGGFPCQDISTAGSGAGLAGERSGLWREYARLIRAVLPRFVVIENVSALAGRGLSAVLGHLAACGYDAEWDVIGAAAVGACHRRDRLFIIAWRNDANPDSGKGRQCLKRGKEKGGEASGGRGERFGGQDAPDANGGGCKGEREPQHKDEQGALRAELNGLVSAGRWAREGFELNPWETLGSVRPVDDGIPGRVAMLRALGNAVVPQVAYQVGLRVKQIAEASIR